MAIGAPTPRPVRTDAPAARPRSTFAASPASLLWRTANGSQTSPSTDPWMTTTAA